MSQADMVNLRRRIRLVDPGRVTVRFEDPVGEVHTLGARFICTACEYDMAWSSTAGWWACPECGYELTVSEARAIVKLCRTLLKTLAKQVDGRRPRRWRWRTLFGRRADTP
jgi:predicted RNA-binding Zn-ribbon protein involved in translation (DUF1610 family)